MASVAADMIISPEHRTLGPALRLYREAIDGESVDNDFCYSCPNKVSRILPARRGFQLSGQLTSFARPVSVYAFLTTKMPHVLALPISALIAPLAWAFDFAGYLWSSRRWRGLVVSAPDSMFDSLWQNARSQNTALGVRDCEFLAWRFGPKFSSTSRFFVIQDRRTGELGGYAVYEGQRGEQFVVLDFLARNNRATLRRLLRMLVMQCRREEARSAAIEFMGNPAVVRSLLTCGFRPRGSNPVYFHWHPSPENQGLPDSEADWYFTRADNDV